jgi:hypothetical protein
VDFSPLESTGSTDRRHGKDSSLMDRQPPLSFPELAWKTVVVHTLSYFLAGVAAFLMLDYERRFAEPPLSHLMRPTDDVMVLLGPVLQPVRGLVFAVVFWLIRGATFERPDGWRVLWTVLVLLGIVGTFGPAPGSIEGLIYTRLPIPGQLLGLTEVLAQSLLLAWGTWYWVRHPEQRWLGRVLTALFVVVLALPLLGLLSRSIPAR